MSDNVESLRNQLQTFEDHLSIKQLRYSYCYAMDEQDWDSLETLFTPDATLDYGGLGTYSGQEGIREFAETVVESQLRATAHAVHNPVLSIKGDTATGKWYVTSPILFEDGTGGFRWGRYNESYRRLETGWKISALTLRFLFATDFDKTSWGNWQYLSPD